MSENIIKKLTFFKPLHLLNKKLSDRCMFSQKEDLEESDYLSFQILIDFINPITKAKGLLDQTRSIVDHQAKKTFIEYLLILQTLYC